MCLNTYLIYCLISCVIFISSIPFIYRERTKANIEEKSKGTDRSGRKRTRAAPRAVCHPDRLVLFPVLFHPSGGKGRQRKRARRMEGREGTRAKDAADLSPVPRISSVSSAASTVHTIASGHLLTLSQKEREGRPPRPLLGDVIATPHHTSSPIDHQQQGSPPTVCHPSRRVPVLFLFPSVRW